MCQWNKFSTSSKRNVNTFTQNLCIKFRFHLIGGSKGALGTRLPIPSPRGPIFFHFHPVFGQKFARIINDCCPTPPREILDPPLHLHKHVFLSLMKYDSRPPLFDTMSMNLDQIDYEGPHIIFTWVIFFSSLQEWEDIRLQWSPEDYGNVSDLVVPPFYVWLPELTLMNA